MTRAVAMLLASVLLGGCGTGAAGTRSAAACSPVDVAVDQRVEALPAPAPRLPVTVRSADGRQVTVTDTARILAVNLYGSLAEIVFALGLGDRLVGRDRATTFPGAADLPLVTGSGHDLTAEAVLALDPTVVLADASTGPKRVLGQLRAAGIPIVMVDDEQTVAAVSRHVRDIAGALGVPAAGERLAARIDAELAAARGRTTTTRPTVAFLYLRGTAGVYLVGGDGAGSDDIIEAAGGVDAGSKAGLSGFRPMTSESLVAAAPDVLLVMTKSLASVGGVDGLLRLPGVAQTPAGERRRIISMDDGVLLGFGTRTPRVVTALADALHTACA